MARVRKTRLLMPLECSSHCLYTASYVHARRTSSNDKTSRRRSRRVDIGLRACAHASSIATFIPADPWNPRSVFEFATSGCDADREKRHPPAIQVCSFDPIEICILMMQGWANCRRSVPAQRSPVSLVKHPRSFDEAVIKDW